MRHILRRYVYFRWMKFSNFRGPSLFAIGNHQLHLAITHVGFYGGNLKFGVHFDCTGSASTSKIKDRRRSWFYHSNPYEPASGIL